MPPEQLLGQVKAVRRWARVHVTFDDAFRSIGSVLSGLRDLGVPITIFVCSGYADRGGAPLLIPELAGDDPEELRTMAGWHARDRHSLDVGVSPSFGDEVLPEGLVAIVGQAIDVVAGRPVTLHAMTIASFLSSAALLGGACTAMILGHWYLVIPSLPASHLQSIVKLHMASMVVRVAVVIAATVFAIATWQPGLGPSFRHYITSAAGIFFWQRVLFGLCGPALLSYLTWETAKIQSTQSATGILYVDFFTVVVGEVLAKYILLSTRVPV